MTGRERLAQSALEPAGLDAAQIHEIWNVLLVGAILIFAGVMALTAYVLLRDDDRPRPVGGRTLVIGAGFLFPVVTLFGLLLYVLPIGARLGAAAPEGALRIEAIGKLWWWEFRYPEQDGRPAFATANQIVLPAGRPVELVLVSDNVIHSFWIPGIAGKIDLIPGHLNRKLIRATAPATLRGQCAEYCGAQHAWMAFDTLVLPEAEFAAWAQRQAEPVATPLTPVLARGRQLFVESGCGACHHVRGLPEAPGGIGPDLTRVGARPTIGAGLLPTSIGSLAGWIANPQALKPGVQMPAFDQLPGEDLRALAMWLASLE